MILQGEVGVNNDTIRGGVEVNNDTVPGESE